MSQAWIVIAALAVATAVIKAVGPVTVGGRPLPERALEVIALLAPALLGALVAVETLSGEDGALVLDARAGGVAAAGVALALRAPLMGAVTVAAVTAALLRALG